MGRIRKVKYHPKNEEGFEAEVKRLGIRSGDELTEEDIKDDMENPEVQVLRKHIASKLENNPNKITKERVLILPRFENKEQENKYWTAYGEIHANEKARMILRLLARDKMLLNQLVKPVNGTWTNLKKQIDKMLEIGLIEAEEIEVKKKKSLIRTVYSAPYDLFSAFDMTQEYMEEKGIVKKLFGDNVKTKFVGALGSIMGSFIGWDMFRQKYNTVNPNASPILDSPFYEQSFFWIMFGIIAFMVIERVIGLIKKRKR